MAVLVAPAVVLGSCSGARLTSASLAAEPVLAPLPGELELATVTLQPRPSRIGVPSADGVVERIVAVDLLPAAAADLVQQLHDSRYRFRRVELGVGTPVTVELRGVAPTEAEVIVTASSNRPVPLYGSPDDVRTPPPDRATSVVVSVVSRQ
ncbi:MAG: hypothetical protein AVDCRST_MAG76-3147 [uncultured Acidimicrobiales bacterium]|uniref:Uncharacterized protein n=1 Tax=uncultured Acidimicrobiales bacterium TaxID=310071 RepID=A0A6J4J1V0_9ACTN|nr:MAG: hypothetical protein AVDCRST_MAG76-3147 [uncultured Acidimicrobiales bacterium]